MSDWSARLLRVKEFVTMQDIFNYEGVEYRENSNMICPLPTHNDTDPSFKSYGENWYCFGEGKGGDVLDFVMAYKEVEFKKALEYLESIFSGMGRTEHGLPKLSVSDIKKRELGKYIYKFKESADKVVKEITDRYSLLAKTGRIGEFEEQLIEGYVREIWDMTIKSTAEYYKKLNRIVAVRTVCMKLLMIKEDMK